MENLVFGTIFLMHIQINRAFPSALPATTCKLQHMWKPYITDDCTYDNHDYVRAGAGIRELLFNGSEGKWNDGTLYSNISVEFPTGFSGIVQLVHMGRHEDVVHLQVDLRGLDDKPFSLVIRSIPFHLRNTSVRMIRPLDFPRYPEQDPCKYPDITQKCLKLTTLDVRRKENTLQLHLTNTWTDPIRIELYGRPCDSSCSEPLSVCPTNLTVIEWLHPVEGLTINQLIAANYCARAVFGVNRHDCCSIYSRTVPVLFDQTIPHTDHNFHISTFFYFMFSFFILSILFTILLYCRTLKKVIRLWSRESISRTETTPLSKLCDEQSLTDVLLVYPNKGCQFTNLMSTFRAFLRAYSKKVWDPLEERQVENVIANPAKWMQGVLMIPNIKIVLVETEEAIDWYDHRTVDIDERDLYFPVLSLLHNQPELSYDYRRLHVVRFHKLKDEDVSLLSIVPLKRYKMPYQIGLLMKDLTNCHEDMVETENNSPALQRFYKATEDYLCSQERS